MSPAVSSKVVTAVIAAVLLLAHKVMMREGTDAAMRWVEAHPDDAPNNQKKILFNVISSTRARNSAAPSGASRSRVIRRGPIV